MEPRAEPPDWLRALAARLGENESLVQGAGGNLSLKDAQRMWIKASGTWMSEALRRPVFAQLDLGRARAEWRREGGAFVDAQLGDATLRPSIETAMHVVMPQALVAHVHSLAALAWLVRRDAREALAPRMEGLPWAWVDYVRPGLPLAEEVERCMRGASVPDVVLLANHGVIVGAGDEASLLQLVEEVERRLRSGAVRADFDVRRDALRRDAGPDADIDEDTAHALAFSPRLDELASGVLFPDQAVFLGRSFPVLEPGDAPRLRQAIAGPPHWAVVRERGVVFAGNASRALKAMAVCLAGISARLDDEAPLRFLTGPQVDELIGWEAEKFRQAAST